jgi:hypothetical protein
MHPIPATGDDSSTCLLLNKRTGQSYGHYGEKQPQKKKKPLIFQGLLLFSTGIT